MNLKRAPVVGGRRCPCARRVAVGADARAPGRLEDGHVALGLRCATRQRRHVHAGDGASRRREQRAAGDAEPRPGLRTALATATRGNGGQNEIGPEIFEALGVLRTEELAALHRFDGAEQYFTRAVDFGYSFSIEETFEKWGRDEITRRLRAADPHDPSRRDAWR